MMSNRDAGYTKVYSQGRRYRTSYLERTWGSGKGKGLISSSTKYGGVKKIDQMIAELNDFVLKSPPQEHGLHTYEEEDGGFLAALTRRKRESYLSKNDMARPSGKEQYI